MLAESCDDPRLNGIENIALSNETEIDFVRSRAIANFNVGVGREFQAHHLLDGAFAKPNNAVGSALPCI